MMKKYLLLITLTFLSFGDNIEAGDTCSDNKDPITCGTKEGCVWCKSKAVPSACLQTIHATSLPTSVFFCDFKNEEGLEKIGERYEPDPDKWKTKPRSAATVWFEFLHVRRGHEKERYLVKVIVHKLADPNKDLPSWPLSKAAPKPVHFSLEFMEAFAECKLSGAKFEGISFFTIS